jgi:hypothetical protein
VNRKHTENQHTEKQEMHQFEHDKQPDAADEVAVADNWAMGHNKKASSTLSLVGWYADRALGIVLTAPCSQVSHVIR